MLASANNIFDLRITDFGLATIIKDGKRQFLQCGSPGYVAPEILQEKGCDSQADMFSAAVILYGILTGRPLFRGNIEEIIDKNRKCEYNLDKAPQWRLISNSAKDLCHKLLIENPDERMTAQQALAHPWFSSTEESKDSTCLVVNNKELTKQRQRMQGGKSN